MAKENYKLAQTYVLGSRNWSIVPTKGKIPIIAWQEYQNRKPTAEELKEWFEKTDNNMAVVTGKISGIIVLDIDDPKFDYTKIDLPPTLIVATGGGGKHFYFKYPEGKEINCMVKDKLGKGMELKADGGLATLPPSIHPNGNQYKLDIANPSYNFKGIADAPKWLLDKATEQYRDSNWKEIMISPIENGSRNMNFTSIIGGLLCRFPMDEWISVVWPMVQDKNVLQKKPLSLLELKTIFESIAKQERRKRHQGGEIKDITTNAGDEEIRIDIRLEQCMVCFKIKNIISSLAEANAITWIQKSTGLTHEIPFYLKVKSDSNKEQWARILSKAFDKKENKEVYPWTIIVAKVVNEVETQIRTRQQDFVANMIEPKECRWLLEPFVQESQINTIFGMGSSGKTLLSLFFSKLIAQELDHKILFIDYEDIAGGWITKLTKITSLNNFTVGLDKFIYYDSEQIPIAEQVDKIKEVIKKHDIKFVIVDSASLATGDSTSDEKSAVRLVSALKLLKTTVLLIAHQRKNDGDRTPIGSIQYENQSRNVWNIKGSPDDADIHTIHLACTHTKANNTYLRREPQGFKIEYTDEHIKITRESAQTYFGDKYTIAQKIGKLLKKEGELDNKSIAEALRISVASAAKNLSEGKEKGLFENNNGKWDLKYSDTNLPLG